MTDLEKEYIKTVQILAKQSDESFKTAIETVLNLIKRRQREKELHIKLEQQYKKEYLDAKEEIEKYKHLYQKALDNTIKADRENVEKDKIITLMAEQLTTPIHSKEWVIEYYTKKAETEDK